MRCCRAGRPICWNTEVRELHRGKCTFQHRTAGHCGWPGCTCRCPAAGCRTYPRSDVGRADCFWSLINWGCLLGCEVHSHHWMRMLEPGGPEHWKIASWPMYTAVLPGTVSKLYWLGFPDWIFPFPAFQSRFVPTSGWSLNFFRLTFLLSMAKRTDAVVRYTNHIHWYHYYTINSYIAYCNLYHISWIIIQETLLKYLFYLFISVSIIILHP